MTSHVVKRHSTIPFVSQLQSNNQALTTGLIILNQPFSLPLLKKLWSTCGWRSCADGGANRLYDVLSNDEQRSEFLPDLIRGDFDSIREDVKAYYLKMGVDVIHDPDQDSTDLQKCLSSFNKVEQLAQKQYTVIILGGLSGRLDQTVHTLALLHKLRKTRESIYAISDENLAWVLDVGEHSIQIDLQRMGPTCGLLPVGIESTTLSTRGLRWNLTDAESSFEGLVSTSNHVIASDVWIKTTKPIWWCVELKKMVE